MEIEYTDQAKDDLEFWKKSGNKVVQKKIQQLVDDMVAHPYEGLGKPEALKTN